MKSFKHHPHYQVYLLRVWREQPGSPNHPPVWRFSLENPDTGQRHGFISLEALMASLQVQIAEVDESRRPERR